MANNLLGKTQGVSPGQIIQREAFEISDGTTTSIIGKYRGIIDPSSGNLLKVNSDGSINVSGGGGGGTSASYAESVLVNVASISASGTSNAIGAANTYLTLSAGTTAVTLSCRITYGGAITAAPVIYVYAGWSDSSVSSGAIQWDTDAFTSFSPTYVASTTKQATANINVGGAKYIAVQVSNADTVNALGQTYVSAQVMVG